MTPDRYLKLLTWPDYTDPESVRRFEADFAVRVDLVVVPNAVELVRRMLLNNSEFDVLIPPDYSVRELAAAGLLLDLEHRLLPNAQFLEGRFLTQRAHDPESRLSLVKDWGTTGYMYRTDTVDADPGTWVDFWDLAERFSGRITLLDAPAEVIGAALKMRGRPYNACGPDDLMAARADLLRLAPHVLAFDTDYRPRITSGEACLALGWSGDASALRAQGVPVRYVIPSEGSQIWEDDWAISRGTHDREASHFFINFMLRPDIAAREALYTRYATGNRAAWALLPEAIRTDASIYPPPEVLARLEPGLPLDPEGAERRAALWREIRLQPDVA